MFGADLPLVVGLDQDGAGQAEQGRGVGEDPTTSGRGWTSLLSRSRWRDGQDVDALLAEATRTSKAAP